MSHGFDPEYFDDPEYREPADNAREIREAITAALKAVLLIATLFLGSYALSTWLGGPMPGANHRPASITVPEVAPRLP